jgi:DNA-directed RNA polymerase subunit N (RpoN/RPB10)
MTQKEIDFTGFSYMLEIIKKQAAENRALRDHFDELGEDYIVCRRMMRHLADKIKQANRLNKIT